MTEYTTVIGLEVHAELKDEDQKLSAPAPLPLAANRTPMSALSALVCLAPCRS